MNGISTHHEGQVYTPPPEGRWQRARLAQRIRRGTCGHVISEFEALKEALGTA